MLRLNVGGHIFTTSLETMTKDPCIQQYLAYYKVISV